MIGLNRSNQPDKINKRQHIHKAFPDLPAKISKSNLVALKEIKKISSLKSNHQSILKLKKDIHNLIDFQRSQIGLTEIPTTHFSKHIHISQNFQLITLDGEPIPELMLCIKCNQVRARCRLAATPIVRHLKQHEKIEKPGTMDKNERQEE